MKKVLGVKIDDVNEQEAVETVCSWVVDEKKTARYIVTTGPEFLVTAGKDPEFKEILNNSDLSVPDGVGLKLAGVKNVIHGVDLMLKLCRRAAQSGWVIGLLGGQEGVASKTKDILRKKFPGIKIGFALDGSDADSVMGRVYSKGLNRLLECDILFVNLGHPKQEKFISSAVRSPLKAFRFKVGMGVGGSFDLISGKLPMPPKALRLVGLGWLYRLITEKPGKRRWRLRRIINAVVIFPWLLLTKKY